MNTHPIKTQITCWLIVSLACLLQGLNAQQTLYLRNYDYYPELLNPALKGSHHLSSLRLIHQNAQVGSKVRSHGQGIFYSSPDMGATKKMAWGLNLNSDFLGIQTRLDASAALAIHLVDKRTYTDPLFEDTLKSHLKISLGGMAGLLYQTADYSTLTVNDHGDPFAKLFQEIEPNLGAGLAVQYQNQSWKFKGGAMVNQLPQLIQSEQTMQFNPHAYVHAGALFHWRDSLWIGPQVTYKDVFGGGAPLVDGSFAYNARAYWSRYHLWGGVGYRPYNQGINFELGLCLAKRDSTGNGRYFPQRWDVNAIFDIPLNARTLEGPTWEVGLAYNFGSLKKVKYDTIDVYLGPVWLHSGNLNRYLLKKLPKEDQPTELQVRSENDTRYVTVSYEFSDEVYQYDPEHHYGLIRLLGHLSEQLMTEAFHPEDHRGYSYPEHLASLEEVIFQCHLRDDAMALNFLADSVVFEEPLALTGKMVYDRKDTTLTIPPGKRLTNLELAYLKMYKLRETFRRMGHSALSQPETSQADIETISLISNNPNLEAWQKNTIIFKFKKNNHAMKKRH